MGEPMELKVGEEKPVQLPPAPEGSDWSHDVGGMASAVSVQRMWSSDPYPEDYDEDTPGRPRRMVFMIRGTNPGRAVVRFTLEGGGGEDRTVDVTVSS